MAKPKILVTGATGKTGGAVVDELLKKGFPVRAVVRARDARSEALARKGGANRLRAFISFNLTLFYPGYDLKRWVRQTGFPLAPNPSLSIDDDRWREEHSLQNMRQQPPATPLMKIA